jgi:Na+/melibiose symporter-like transporter
MTDNGAAHDWERLQTIQKVALVGRFLLEVAGVAALVWWGIKVGTDDVSRAGLALLAGGGLIVIWALVVAPKARNPLSPMTRWLIGTVLLMVAAVALWTVGPQELAVLYALLVGIDTAVLLWIDARGVS